MFLRKSNHVWPDVFGLEIDGDQHVVLPVLRNKFQHFIDGWAPAAINADWAYVRFLPSKEQIEAVHRAGKQAFIAGPTVAENVPENWQHCADVGLDAILTDYPLELRTTLRK